MTISARNRTNGNARKIAAALIDLLGPERQYEPAFDHVTARQFANGRVDEEWTRECNWAYAAELINRAPTFRTFNLETRMTDTYRTVRPRGTSLAHGEVLRSW